MSFDVISSLFHLFREWNTALAGAFLATTLLAAIVLMFWPKPNPFSIKLLGSLMVLGLALSTSNSWVYGVAIFIVATLVTELEFLEKLAAIVWRQKEYWDYRLRDSSRKEIEEKRKAETMSLETSESAMNKSDQQKESPKYSMQRDEKFAFLRSSAPGVTERPRDQKSLRNMVEFERAVIEALRQDKELFGSKLAMDLGKTLIASGRRSVIDAIIEKEDVHYLIEIKWIVNYIQLGIVIKHAMMVRRDYRQYLAAQGRSLDAQLIMIVQAEAKIPDFIEGIPILKFDEKNRKFSNIEKVRLYLDTPFPMSS